MHEGGKIGNLDVTYGQEDDLLSMFGLADLDVNVVTHWL